MIDATRRWLRRNRINFAIGFGVLGVGFLAGQYIINKISEARERINSDRIAKENLRRRFAQNQEDCTFTVLALLPTAADNILEALPVENITHELQQQRAERSNRSTAASSDVAPSEFSSSGSGEDGKSLSSFQTESFVHTSQMGSSTLNEPRPKKTKTQLWSELKISSITRSFTLIYTLSLLTILTRVQLNLLGRRSYISSVVSMATPRANESISLETYEDIRTEGASGVSFETNRNFLAFSWWLLHRGWRDLMDKVEAAVNEVFGPINPREEMSFEKLAELVLETRRKIEGTTDKERSSQNWLPYILPPMDQETYVLRESGVLPSRPPSSPSPSPPTSPPANAATTATTTTSPFPKAPASSPPTLFSQLPLTTSTPLRALLDETADILESPRSATVLTRLLDALFSQLVDTAILGQAYKTDALVTVARVLDLSEASVIGGSAGKVRLANVLAVVTRQAHGIGNGVPNAYVQAMEAVKELEALAVVVYCSRVDVERGEGAEGGLRAEGWTAEAKDVGVAAEGAVGEAVEGKGAGEVGEQGREKSVEESKGFVASTWGMFESVWSSVAGK